MFIYIYKWYSTGERKSRRTAYSGLIEYLKNTNHLLNQVSCIILVFLRRKVPAQWFVCLLCSGCSGGNPSGTSHLLVPSLSTIPAYCLDASIWFSVLLLLLTARDSPFFPVKQRRLAGQVWWLRAVVCSRCINKVGKRTSNIFSSFAQWNQEGQPLKKKYRHRNEHCFFL